MAALDRVRGSRIFVEQRDRQCWGPSGTQPCCNQSKPLETPVPCNPRLGKAIRVSVAFLKQLEAGFLCRGARVLAIP